MPIHQKSGPAYIVRAVRKSEPKSGIKAGLSEGSPASAASVKTVAEFSIPYLQYLDTEGSSIGPLPPCANDHAELIKMYRMMVLARTFDVKAVNLQRTGKLGTYPPALGHEAVQVACGAALKAEDCIAPVYREIGTQLWRGVRMTDILLYWGGDERGNDFAVPTHDFPWCVPIATQTLHAAGAALAYKIRGERRVAMAFIGDGGTSEGSFYEAMNVAGVQKLPVVFMVVNNQWAISVPLAQQTATQTLAQKAIAAGVEGLQFDGNDFLAARHAIGTAVEKARAGGGPTVLEAITYRLSDHTTADDASRYRSAQEVKDAWVREPIKRSRALLERLNLWDEQKEATLKAECTQQVEAAVQEFLSTAKQSTDTMFDYLFADPPQNLKAQKEMARRYAARKV
jgi:pyruvate dehydrogenase E1 component alpha subunit